MKEYSELKRLAENATPGEWAHEQDNLYFYEDGYTRHMMELSEGSDIGYVEQKHNSDFIAAANPEVILELIAEVEGLHAQHGRDSAELRSLCQARDDARKERDQLKEEVERLNEEYDKAWRHDLNDKNNVQVLAAEVEALRKDAERYRFLRQDISNNVQDFCIVKKRWSATFPDRILELDGADAEIDAAMSNKE